MDPYSVLSREAGRHQTIISMLDPDDVALDYKALMKAERAAYMAEQKAKEAAKSAKTADIRGEVSDIAVTDPPGSHITAFDIGALGIEFKRINDVAAYKVGPIPDLYYFPNVCQDDSCLQIQNAVNLPAVSSGVDPVSPRRQEASLQNYKDYVKQKEITPDLWLQVRSRQLQCWGRQVEGEGGSVAGEEVSRGERMPRYLAELGNQIYNNILVNLPEEHNLSQENHFNHVLINKYLDVGGILHHTDGPRYSSLVAILSLGGPTVMSFREKLPTDQIGVRNSSDLFSVVLESNSLLVFTKEMYTDYLHGISPDKSVEVVGECGECVNLHLLSDRKDAGDVINRRERLSLTFRNVQH